MRSFCAVLLLFLFGSCIYESPLTESPTRKIDERLIGDWVSVEEKLSDVQVRKFDDSNFILIDDRNVYRVFHSDLGGLSFLSLQNLDTTGRSARKFAFIDYRFEEPNKIRVRAINKDIVPETLKTVPELQKIVREHLKDPRLFNKEEMVYTRKTGG